MSGPQHIAWYQTSRREIAGGKLRDLEITMSRSESYFDAEQLRDRLDEMARGKND